jgi:Flp pilus assembly protein TadD
MAGSGEKDAKGTSEDRTTERRLLTASAVMQAVDSTRDVASEDFLFHLYRGSELLQDNRVLEAKEELEQALTLQPRDPKGQDLLAVVYFRIGLYPRAIQIYEQLKRDNPKDSSLKLNLSLCYLKTGQTQAARGELEDVVRLHPNHKRAWGYLGLAYERLSDLSKAIAAFERAGHPQMARRVSERQAARSERGAVGEAKPQPVEGEAEVRGAAAAAFEELDAGEISFSLAEPITGSQQSGTWRAVEPGAPQGAPSQRHAGDGWTVPPSAEAVASMRSEEIAGAANDPGATPLPSPPGMPGRSAVPMPLTHLTRATHLAFPEGAGVRLQPSGVVLVRTTGSSQGGGRPFAARVESVRLHIGAIATEVLPRRTRGKPTGESFGGVASPIASLAGTGDLVLSPRTSHSVVPFAMAEEIVTVREDLLLGFELAGLTYENGKLALGDGESAHVVQLRGTGAVLLELLTALQSVELHEGRPIVVRREALVGWTGAKISPRALPPAEAPSGQRGLLSLAGDGTVFLTTS